MKFRESETVELKEIVVDDIKKEIIAFANCAGGKLFVGVQDDGTVIGLDDADSASLQISNMVRDAIKPDLTMFLHYEILEDNGAKVLVVDVQKGTQRPYYLAKKGLRPEGVYVRQGSSTVPATSTAIRQMIKETDGDHFEEMRSLEQHLTFERAEKEFTAHHLEFGLSQKKTLGVMTQDGVYTNLGLLLSDQCVHTIKIAVFEGTTPAQFKDRKECTGSLFQQMDEAYAFIDFRNQLHSSFKQLRRIDKRDYPEIAIREALLNLLVHREYAFRASAFISIYSDRIEFVSIGGLVSGMSLEDVETGLSVCRNVKLANVFYRLELIEAYGTGIKKIFGAYEGTGRKPLIETTDNAFKVVLPNLNVAKEGILENTNFIGDVITRFFDKGLKDSQVGQVVALAQKQGFISRMEVEKALAISQTTSGRLLRQLVEQEILVKVGDGRSTRYCLAKHQ